MGLKIIIKKNSNDYTRFYPEKLLAERNEALQDYLDARVKAKELYATFREVENRLLNYNNIIIGDKEQ